MGLAVSIKGYEDAYDCGYISFASFRFALADTFNKEYGELYKKWCLTGLSIDECNRANKLIEGHEALDLFLCHSDCDGKFTPNECRRIYAEIKDFQMDMLGHNYKDANNLYNVLEKWKDMFLYCSKHRVNMFFT